MTKLLKSPCRAYLATGGSQLHGVDIACVCTWRKSVKWNTQSTEVPWIAFFRHLVTVLAIHHTDSLSSWWIMQTSPVLLNSKPSLLTASQGALSWFLQSMPAPGKETLGRIPPPVLCSWKWAVTVALVGTGGALAFAAG